MTIELKTRSLCTGTCLVWVLIALTGVCVAGIEISTLGHLKASLISNLQLHGSTITLPSIIGGLRTTIRLIDVFFVLSLGACIVVAVVGEIKNKLFSNFLEWVFAMTSRIYLLLFVLGTVGTLYYWVPGYILAHDASSHVPGAYFVFRSLENGESLFWWNYWSLGGPSFLQFYGPLYFLLAGGVGAVLGDATIGTKVTLWALHVFSGFSSFLYVRQISKSSTAAFVSGVIYVYAFAHTHLILWKGALPQALIFLFFPLALYFLERYLRGNGQRRSLCAFTAISALLIISHPGMGVYSGWFIFLYIGVQMCFGFKELRQKIAPLAISGFFSVAISSFLIVPMRYEMSYTVAAGQLSQSPFPGLGLPTVQTIKDALLWYNAGTGAGHDNVAYLGVTSVVLALFGLWYYFPKRNNAVIGLLVLLVSAFVIQASHIREVVFALTAVSALAGMGVLALEELFRKRHVRLGRKLVGLIGPKSIRLTVIIMGFVLMDLGPTTIQSLYRTDKEYILEMGKKLEKSIGSARIIEGEAKEDGLFVNVGSGGSPLLYFQIPLVFGPYLGGPWTQNYAAVLVSEAFAELNKDRMLSEVTLQGLRLLNVRYILINSRFKYVLPDLIPTTGYSLDKAVPAIEIGDPNFVWYSSAVSSKYNLSDDLEKLLIGPNGLRDPKRIREYTTQMHNVIGNMELDSESGVAKRFFVKDTRGYNSNPTRLIERKVEVSKVTFDASRIAVDLTVDQPGFVQLSYPYYPYLEVLVNGEKIEPLVGAIPFIVVPVQTGRSHITISPYLSPLRKATLVISGLAGLGLLAVWMHLGTLLLSFWRGRVSKSADE